MCHRPDHSKPGYWAPPLDLSADQGLTIQVGGILLFDDEDSVASLHELSGGDQSGQARPDNGDVCAHGANAID